MIKKVKGFKGFDENLVCNPNGKPFKYEIGKTYETKDDIRLCKSGFHFCRNFKDVNGFYNFSSNNFRFCEVEALGKVVDQEDCSKSVTNKIKIVREISKQEMCDTLNEGKGNAGFFNTGNSNTGDWNTGDSNTGNRNTGNSNTGNRNTGDSNTGYWNTGDWNTGDRNTGYWNKTNRSAGVLCNQEPKVMMFNKTTDMTWDEWRGTRAIYLLSNITKSEWVYFSKMTDKEKQTYKKSAETCGGYLKEYTRAEATKKWWNELDNYDKLEIFNLPNFNVKVFNDIMELEITKKEYNEVFKGAKNS